MKHKGTFILAILILIVFLLYSVSFQVRFNETAVKTRFGKATEASVINAGAEAEEAGLHFKWFYPIENVYTYDKRIQMLEDRLEEQQTLDKQGVIVNTYVAWRIVDPLSFFRNLRTVEEAERQIRSRLRDARSVIGQFTFDELTNTDTEQLKLEQVEKAILEKMQAALDAQPEGQSFGIRFESVGIKRVILPQSVTTAVFDRMEETRQRLAQRARSAGDGEATAIRAKAESARDRILSFAEQRAQTIRAEGDAAASQYYDVFQQDEQFASFLLRMEMLEKVLSNNTTWFLDADQGPMRGLGGPRDALQAAEPQEVRATPAAPLRAGPGDASPGDAPATGPDAAGDAGAANESDQTSTTAAADAKR